MVKSIFIPFSLFGFTFPILQVFFISSSNSKIAHDAQVQHNWVNITFFLADICTDMAWVSELEYFDDLFRSETQELDVLEEEWTKNRVSERS